MKIAAAALASLVASASAFAPSTTSGRTATAGQAQSPFANEIGAQAPLGFWDPAGSLLGADQETFEFLRARELTNGRVAMLAVVGYLTTLAGIRFPGCEDVPCGIPAFSNMPPELANQFAMTMIFCVIANQPNKASGVEPEFYGDFRNGFIDFGWDKFTDEQKRTKRTIELNNGRAAMMGITGLVTHELMGNLDAIIPGYQY